MVILLIENVHKFYDQSVGGDTSAPVCGKTKNLLTENGVDVSGSIDLFIHLDILPTQKMLEMAKQ